MKKLTATISQMASKMKNNENSNPNTGSGDRESRHPQMKKARNMEGYCHSHGFHPIWYQSHKRNLQLEERRTQR
jgi:hypothetical protein